MNYFERVGIEFDIALNVLFGGQLGQTISLRAAIAQRDGHRWGCIFCKILSVLVQRNHCADQFKHRTFPASVYVRAGIAFAFGGIAVWLMTRAALGLIGVRF